MIYQTYVFEDAGFYIATELKSVFDNDNLINDLLKKPEVARFVELSRKLISKDTLTSDELSEFNNLLLNDDVKTYLENIDDILKKKQFISFSLLGVATTAPLIILNPIIAVMAMIGSGIIVGTGMTKILSVLRRWKTIEEYRKWISGMKQNTKNIELTSGNVFKFNKKFFNE